MLNGVYVIVLTRIAEENFNSAVAFIRVLSWIYQEAFYRYNYAGQALSRSWKKKTKKPYLKNVMGRCYELEGAF